MRSKEALIKSAGSGVSDKVKIEILADIRDILGNHFGFPECVEGVA